MDWHKQALEILQETSRTFYIPIVQLPSGLQEAVTSGYLCMRAIDEIEDHPHLTNPVKAKILRAVSLHLQSGTANNQLGDFAPIFAPYYDVLPEVSLRLGEWAILADESISPRIWEATAAMSDRMAGWADVNWRIDTEADLNSYTFSVAGAVGLLLSDLWAWYDGTQTNRSYAIGFGRGLQTVNILRNRQEDLSRNVDFFPDGWTSEDMHNYTRSNLVLADAYISSLPEGPALEFCKIPFALASATLDALTHGQEKLTRSDVAAVIEQLMAKRG
jgi:farnesyl-diphosphate farnesyltransferase